MPTSSRIARQQTAGYTPDKDARKIILNVLRAAGKSTKTQKINPMLRVQKLSVSLRNKVKSPKTKRANKKET
jgi:hypothetical protein